MYEKKIADIIGKILNDVVINSDYCTDNGLANGKFGNLLFLYMYSEFADNEILFDWANEMLLAALETLDDTQLSYHEGLPGIADVMNYLNKQDFLDIPDRGVFFENVIVEIQKKYSTPSIDWVSLRTSIFLLADFRGPDLAATGDLSILLNFDRAIEHVDLIETQLSSYSAIKVQQLDLLVENHVREVLYQIKKTSVTLDFLRELGGREIAPELVSKLSTGIKGENKILTHYFFNLVDVEMGLGIADSLYIWAMLLNNLLTYGHDVNDGQIRSYIEKLIGLVEKLGSADDIDFKKKTMNDYLGLVLQCIQINSFVNNEKLGNAISLLLYSLASPLDQTGDCSRFCQTVKMERRSGTSGIAGLGIVLLIYLDKKYLSCAHLLTNLKVL